ncbi:metal-dependent hydrolase [Oenococcus alcoholitolerans]|uniref:metal-dependent hydrolase n=1 Tax=Oenococcus alcoholitolerans TaxID=931074 RepID=UPI003F708B9B
MKITYFGHSAFQIKTGNTTILIDPFINDNPFTKVRSEDLDPDFIILTHAHFDHVGDAFEISRRTGATIITQTDFAEYINDHLPEAKGARAQGVNFGGTFYAEDFSAKMYPAWHTDALDFKGNLMPVGLAAGFALTIENKLIYDTGDTGLFSDLKLVALKKPVDLALICIGGHFTMDADDAVIAADYLQAKKVIPIHYNTFPPIKADPQEFVGKLNDGVGLLPKVDQEFVF